MLNFNQLRAFYHVAKNMSFTSAARELFITQPAVTAQVKLFEDYYDLKLFKKKGRGVSLTEEGKLLYEHIRKIFEYEKEIENLIADMKSLKKGLLRLGTTKTYARWFMPFLVGKFLEKYPCIKIHLKEGSSLEMTQSLIELKIDMAIIAKVEEPPDVCFIPFSQEEMVVIAAPDHRFARKGVIPFDELAKEPLIVKENGSGTRKIVNELFARHNCPLNVLMEISNTEFIKQLVEKGEGISFLVKAGIAAEVERGKLAALVIEDERLFLDVSVACPKDMPLSPPARAFLEIVKKLMPEDPFQGIEMLMRNCPPA
jgi:DNA-binding transcriptional LysR family regulator